MVESPDGIVWNEADRWRESLDSFKLGAAVVKVCELPTFDDSQIVATHIGEVPELWGEVERLVKRVEEPLTLEDAAGRSYTNGYVANLRCTFEIWGV